MPDEVEPSDRDEESVSELVERLGRDASRLIFYETALAGSQRIPELRRTARDVAAVIAVFLAFASAFALANWAAVSGLSSVLSGWLAALVLAAVWLVLGALVFAALLVRLGHVSGLMWWRMLGADRDAAGNPLQAPRDEAEEAVRDTLDRLSGAIAREAAGQIASAVMPMAGVAADVGEELLEASDEIVEVIEEQLPGGGTVRQVIDFVLLPGRFGLRVATTAFGRDQTGSREPSG